MIKKKIEFLLFLENEISSEKQIIILAKTKTEPRDMRYRVS